MIGSVRSNKPAMPLDGATAIGFRSSKVIDHPTAVGNRSWRIEWLFLSRWQSPVDARD